MTGSLTAHLGELAETLSDLRRRLRHAARVEVARAVGEALREFAVNTISGSSHYTRPRYSDEWDDPWRESRNDAWGGGADVREYDEEPETRSAESTRPLQAALAMGLGAGRWVFLRTRQWLIAVLIGTAVAVIVITGGPAVEAFLAAWQPAHELLHLTDPYLHG
jgi:hypothetical protein